MMKHGEWWIWVVLGGAIERVCEGDDLHGIGNIGEREEVVMVYGSGMKALMDVSKLTRWWAC